MGSLGGPRVMNGATPTCPPSWDFAGATVSPVTAIVVESPVQDVSYLPNPESHVSMGRRHIADDLPRPGSS